MQIQPRHFEAIVFSAKAAIADRHGRAAVMNFSSARRAVGGGGFRRAGDAAQFAFLVQGVVMRVIANLAGAFGGAALSICIGQPIVAMATGVMLTGLVCHLLKQDDALRPAFVAVIIVTLTGDNHKWHSSLNRVAAVIIGCVCALAVGFLFDKISGVSKLMRKRGSGKTRPSE